ncbi:hypothetical protein SEENIN0B_03037 [Salmonella enterica subsp. enterica serovar Infantis str. SARB27]|uniref:Uncharacterized protein n=1 Tax=Salmonella enterica subsp. enterica serovar Infantis str. SARB27 TaxID=596155 RepID=A0A6C8GCP7_SALIN|nr:hypothetical protein SEENIN0B_03037 [Salmonella enterica subsp. enterica serovar Infantis str. SARB27]
MDIAARFIPAGAGNTPRSESDSSVLPVYPRWRGEHDPVYRGDPSYERFIPAGAGNTTILIPPFITLPGLSPLARGTRSPRCHPRGGPRFIPAGAGNTGVIDDEGEYLAVYPRWRGEHAAEETFHFRRAGLSPLARGTRTASAPLSLNFRFIPAGAGNTLMR